MKSPDRHDAAPRPFTRRAFLSAVTLGGAVTLTGFAASSRVTAEAPKGVVDVVFGSDSPPIRYPNLSKFRVLETRQSAKYAGLQPTAWGTGIRGTVSRFQTSTRQIALTLDACGGQRGSGYDARIIAALRQDRVPATLFLNSRWVQANRAIADDLAKDPLFTIGNHGTRHVPLSVSGRSAYNIVGTHSVQEAIDEVWGCHQLLTEISGKEPTFFRSGTAFYDDVAIRIVSDLGETPIGFAINGDGGATLSANAVIAQMSNPAPGAIIIAHMNQPNSRSGDGVVGAIRTLRAQGWEFVSLEDKQLLTA
ncbi:polysaccharide deacetylase family protein [Smaragdicoccus niigatensis]|uniref:polysaccharide deacetylase family protein n=1 Tax=Smaragdicoccus niigatensis TaxID=359359 RepID=UPI000375BB77|nr:polysaccharide deacetylase family protein [Smaragdicoccus niigatensis]